jgi:hypothetical protein
VTETLAETGRGNPAGAQRLALLPQQIRPARQPDGQPGDRDETAAVYLNMVGAQDDQIFDGASFVLNPGIELAMQMPAFDRVHPPCRFRARCAGLARCPDRTEPLPDEWEQDYRAMVEALKDYVGKSGISKVLLGLSGGSIRRWLRPSPPMRWAQRMCAA